MTIQQALESPNPCNGKELCACPPGRYYVGCIDDEGHHYLMAGPYPTHQAAEKDRSRALGIADDIDGRAWWMRWGVCVMPDSYEEPGRLNKLGLI